LLLAYLQITPSDDNDPSKTADTTTPKEGSNYHAASGRRGPVDVAVALLHGSASGSEPLSTKEHTHQSRPSKYSSPSEPFDYSREGQGNRMIQRVRSHGRNEKEAIN